MKGNKGKILKKGNKQSGITLVALVVTVVVLLILAGISIKLVLDNNGIITRAGDARDKHEQAKANDQADLNSAGEYINQMTGGGSGTGSLPTNDDGSSKPYLPSKDFTQVGGSTLDNGLVIEDKSKNQYVWIEVPKTSDVYGEENLNITEFGDTELDTIKTKLTEYSTNYKGYGYSDTWYDGCGMSQTKYTTTYNNMLKSIYQNGGFWIGRYEIGIDENTARSFGNDYGEHPTTGQTPAIKANKVPYNWITCSQAETLAETFAPSGYTSSLMFGVQWNLVLKYLETKGVKEEDLKIDSTSWGNYNNANFTVKNTNAKYSEDNGATWVNVPSAGFPKLESSSILLTTGADARNSKMNIYDLAGNLYERTLEYTSESGRPSAVRGSFYSSDGSSSPAADWYMGSLMSPYYVGARVALY